MSDVERRQLLMVGGPDAGKSNYLFRFWLAIRDGGVRNLVPDGLPEDLEHLKQGVDAQMQGRFARHTPKDSDTVCEIPILAEGRPAKLFVPDRPGEDWTRIYATRRWPEELSALQGTEAACLVFVRVRSDANVAPLDWITVRKLHGNAANLNQEDGPPGVRDPHPTQVVLTDWVQMLAPLLRRPGERPRIGVVVTAFDLLSDEERAEGPSAYLRANFRLLMDFLDSNVDSLEHAVFGTSLYGCDFEMEPRRRDEILDGDPRAYGFVIHELDGKPVQSG